jgi:DNA-binding response OmpR family regulator
MSAPLTVEEAAATAIDPLLRKLLSPQEVSQLAVLPLLRGPGGDSFTLAADPGTPANAEMVLRMRLGARRVELRPASRQAMQLLLDAHFVPYWSEKGWRFPGLPELPKSATVAAASPSEGTRSTAAAVPAPTAAARAAPVTVASAGEAHPVILLLESSEVQRRALEELFLEAGYEPRSVASLEAVERELRRAPPSLVVSRADGPVPIEVLVGLVRKAGGAVELRVLRDYAGTLLGSAGDERMSSFLFDLVRFFSGIVSAAAGAPIHKSEARAQTAERTARQMGLSPPQVEAARLAALFGDLEGHLRRLHGGGKGAEKEELGAGGLEQLLDPARTPFPIGAALEERRERFDGSGPRRLAGDAISPAGRILAAVDAFFALKDSEVSGAELEARLRSESGKRFDPRAVEAVLKAERAGRLFDRLGLVEERVLVVDPDPVAASLLEMRFANTGFQVEVHRDGESGLAAALEKRPDIVISEVAMPGLDGFSLLLRLRKAEPTREIPFIFVSERTDKSSTVRGFELGADDFIQKPADLELLAAKVKGLVRKARARRPAAGEGGGASGNLADMSIIDVLQVLAASRRTVRVHLEDGRGTGGDLAIDKGRLVHARLGDQTGEEAFFILSSWAEGRFTVRAEEPSGETSIDAPLEGLLLEVCRRRDEASRSF